MDYVLYIKPLGRGEKPEKGWQRCFSEAGEMFYQQRFEGSEHPNLIIDVLAKC